MELSAIFNNVRSSGGGDDDTEIPDWSQIPQDRRDKITPVLERLALIQSLRAKESAEKLDSGQGDSIKVLDTYLMLTCMEMLGRADLAEAPADPSAAESPAHDFSKEPPLQLDEDVKAANGRGEQVLAGETDGGLPAPGTLSNLTSADLREESHEAGGTAITSGAEPARPSPQVKEPEAPSPTVAGPDGILHVFTELLGSSLKGWVARACWVYKDDPVEEWETLHLVNSGYRDDSSEAHRRLGEARKRWDIMTSNEKLKEIAAACSVIRQQFSLGYTARTSQGIMDPLTKVMREAGAAAAEERVNYLSNTAFARLSGTPDHQLLVVEEIESLIKDGELYVRGSDIDHEKQPSWLDRFLRLSMKLSQRGETLIQHNRNLAIVVPEKPFGEHLESWLYSALRNVVS